MQKLQNQAKRAPNFLDSSGLIFSKLKNRVFTDVITESDAEHKKSHAIFACDYT